MNNIKIYRFILILFLVLFLLNSSVAQRGKGENQIQKKRPFYIETHLFQNDSTFTCYISYKIPLNNLLFVKEDNYYSSGYSVNFEFYKDDKFIKRAFGNGDVVTNSYSNSISEKIFHEGVIYIDISEGKYLIKPSVKLNNTDIEARIKPIELIVDTMQIYKPIFVKKEKLLCDSVQYKLVNFQSTLPFSDSEYDMLLPIGNNMQDEVLVKVSQDGKEVLSQTITEFEYLNKNIFDCKKGVVLKNSLTLPLSKFVKLNFINQKLVEGKFEIELKLGKEINTFQSHVFWYNKPKSLDIVEDAIEYLEIIGFSNSADSLLDVSEDEEYQALFSFWKKFDTDTSTTYNSVFNEFYSRIDIVKKEFNSLGKNDALRTDRGITYIIYGKPDSIERKFNDVYDIIEIWDYKNLNEKIYFSDITGTGKFKRIK